MTKKILLACAAGFSTSIMVKKMKEEAISRGMDIVIEACAENTIETNLPADVIMLGPQMGHAEDGVKAKVGHDIPVTVIDMMDYGMMDGKKVLDAALKLMKI